MRPRRLLSAYAARRMLDPRDTRWDKSLSSSATSAALVNTHHAIHKRHTDRRPARTRTGRICVRASWAERTSRTRGWHQQRSRTPKSWRTLLDCHHTRGSSDSCDVNEARSAAGKTHSAAAHLPRPAGQTSGPPLTITSRTMAREVSTGSKTHHLPSHFSHTRPIATPGCRRHMSRSGVS